jgi:type I restriction enzyme M protein
MDKKQLASNIWNAANEMRGSLDANDYKDFILGFMFYKFLSDKQTEFFTERRLPEDEMAQVLQPTTNRYNKIARENLGYYIAYEDLFSTWLGKKGSLDVSDVSEGLGRFEENIAESSKHVFEGIFESFRASIRKLGDNAAAQARKLRAIMNVIKDVPTDSKQNYDVLGYVYEFLIGKFAANAGKKNGEFYTPHTVALVMAELVAEHIKGRDNIEIYDPTSGSGSLLLNIGEAVARRSGNKGKIRYYAQELKQDAYNITRMNLVMRGVSAPSIVTRRADSLDQDWPLIDERGNYDLLRVDAVVSNPPYSAKWDRDRAKGDPRFAGFGYAPENKADYAFLLHELYHLKDDGILTIVLPHGVLFRGGDEEKIRRELIEKNHIETIIGFPPNIFFGTGISTIVMVLKKQRGEDDTIQFVDASKGFVKAGTKRELRAQDVRKIVDTVVNRTEVDKYSCVVSRQEIRVNDYNLNIPRYVDSAEEPEQWDIYATMFGGIPQGEIDQLHLFWDHLLGLRETVFDSTTRTHTQVKEGIEVSETIKNHSSVEGFKEIYQRSLIGFEDHLHAMLVAGVEDVALNLAEVDIRTDMFDRLAQVPIIDEYEVYQRFADQWQIIEPDVETIQLEGWDATRDVEPNMVMRKRDGKDVEVQEGWIGKILPFDLVQQELLTDENETLAAMKAEEAAAAIKRDDLLASIDEEDYGTGDDSITNVDGTSFAAKGVAARLEGLLADVTSPEIEAMREYLTLSKKDKLTMQADHPEFGWDNLVKNKGGDYSKSSVIAYIAKLKTQTEFADGSLKSTQSYRRSVH